MTKNRTIQNVNTFISNNMAAKYCSKIIFYLLINKFVLIKNKLITNFQ